MNDMMGQACSMQGTDAKILLENLKVILQHM